MTSEYCAWGAYTDDQGRQWSECGNPPTADRGLCSHHVGVLNRRLRARAKSHRAKQARKVNR